MGQIWYDREEDVLGIQLARKRYWKSIEVSENVVLDLAEDGEIIGIEILQAGERFKRDAPLIVSRAARRQKVRKLLTT